MTFKIYTVIATGGLMILDIVLQRSEMVRDQSRKVIFSQGKKINQDTGVNYAFTI